MDVMVTPQVVSPGPVAGPRPADCRSALQAFALPDLLHAAPEGSYDLDVQSRRMIFQQHLAASTNDDHPSLPGQVTDDHAHHAHVVIHSCAHGPQGG